MATVSSDNLERFGKGEIPISEVIRLDSRETAALLQTGHTFLMQGKLEEARQIFEGLALLEGKNPFVHRSLGVIHQRQGQDEAALASYTRALAILGSDIQTLTNRGEVYLKLGLLPQAAADFKAAIELDPDAKQMATRRALLFMTLLRETVMMAKEQGTQAVLETKERLKAKA